MNTRLENHAGCRDLPCVVCGEPVGPAPELCRICGANHHFDCFEYNRGCGRFGCRAAPRARPGEEEEAKPGLGKLGLPHKRTGRYPGHLWAPPGPTLLFFLAQLVTLPYLAERAWLGAGVGLFVMATSFLWILCYSVHFYVDFERGWITRARALAGRDYYEEDVMPLSDASQLVLLELDLPGEAEPCYQLVAMPRVEVLPFLTLGPPVHLGSEDLEACVDLLQRVRAVDAFPVEIPEIPRQLEHAEEETSPALPPG